MSIPALKALAVKPIQIPQYRNERIRSFGLWYRDNESTLSDYYSALEENVDFFAFAALQHEREEARLLDRLPHGESL